MQCRQTWTLLFWEKNQCANQNLWTVSHSAFRKHISAFEVLTCFFGPSLMKDLTHVTWGILAAVLRPGVEWLELEVFPICSSAVFFLARRAQDAPLCACFESISK